MAFELAISNKTVENLRQSVMQKLNLFSIAELTKYAVRHGLSPLND
jgi:DNA-binding NarL/FixJ family response regulator